MHPSIHPYIHASMHPSIHACINTYSHTVYSYTVYIHIYILSTYDTQKIYTYYCQCIKVYSSMKVSRLWLSLSRHVDANKVSLMADFEASICLRSGQHLGCNYRFYWFFVRVSGSDLFTPTKQVTSLKEVHFYNTHYFLHLFTTLDSLPQ